MATKKPKPLPVPLPTGAERWPRSVRVLVALLQQGPLPARGPKLLQAVALILEGAVQDLGLEVFYDEAAAKAERSALAYSVAQRSGGIPQPAGIHLFMDPGRGNNVIVRVLYAKGAPALFNYQYGTRIVPRGQPLPEAATIRLSASSHAYGNNLVGLVHQISGAYPGVTAWLDTLDAALKLGQSLKSAKNKASSAGRKVVANLIDALYLAQSSTDMSTYSLVPAMAIPTLTTRGVSHPRGALDPRLVEVLRGTVWTLKPNIDLQYDPTIIGPDRIFFWSGSEWTTLQDRTVNWSELTGFFVRPFNPALDGAPMGNHEAVLTGMLQDYGVKLAWAQLGQNPRWLLPMRAKKVRIERIMEAFPIDDFGPERHLRFWASAAFGYFSHGTTERGLSFVKGADDTAYGVVTSHGPRKLQVNRDGYTVVFKPKDRVDEETRARVEELVGAKLDMSCYMPAGARRLLPLPKLLETL